jgi:predicted nucleic acid-binding protein
LALYYLETSALVKLYVREPGTDTLLRLASEEAGHRLVILMLAAVEFRSAIRRRERGGDLGGSAANQLIRRFDAHVATRFLSQPLNDTVLGHALGLVDRYSLRAYDAVQLAGCIALRDMPAGDQPIFICADHSLIEAAQSEGIPAINPASS